jgi:hypothetical protein
MTICGNIMDNIMEQWEDQQQQQQQQQTVSPAAPAAAGSSSSDHHNHHHHQQQQQQQASVGRQGAADPTAAKSSSSTQQQQQQQQQQRPSQSLTFKLFDFGLSLVNPDRFSMGQQAQAGSQEKKAALARLQQQGVCAATQLPTGCDLGWFG